MNLSSRTNFIVKPQGLHVLLGEIRQGTYELRDSLLTNQMALSFNIDILAGYIFVARPNYDKIVSDRQGKKFLAQD